MNIRNLIFCAFPLAMLVACGGGDDAQPLRNSGPKITVNITLANLPVTLPINQEATPVFRNEYLWSVEFDVNKDEISNSGDMYLRLIHHKRPEAVAADGVLTEFQAEVIQITSDATDELPATANQIADASVEVQGNTLSLTVYKNRHAALDTIDNSVLVQFNTLAYATGGQHPYYRDAFPFVNGKLAYASIPEDGKFMDTDIGMSEAYGIDLQYIDMQSMEVKID